MQTELERPDPGKPRKSFLENTQFNTKLLGGELEET